MNEMEKILFITNSLSEMAPFVPKEFSVRPLWSANQCESQGQASCTGDKQWRGIPRVAAAAGLGSWREPGPLVGSLPCDSTPKYSIGLTKTKKATSAQISVTVETPTFWGKRGTVKNTQLSGTKGLWERKAQESWGKLPICPSIGSAAI